MKSFDSPEAPELNVYYKTKTFSAKTYCRKRHMKDVLLQKMTLNEL